MKINFFENKKTTWGQNWFWDIANSIGKDDYLVEHGINKMAFVDGLKQRGFDADIVDGAIWVNLSGQQVDALVQQFAFGNT